jgi:hypothetical protein
MVRLRTMLGICLLVLSPSLLPQCCHTWRLPRVCHWQISMLRITEPPARGAGAHRDAPTLSGAWGGGPAGALAGPAHGAWLNRLLSEAASGARPAGSVTRPKPTTMSATI